MKKLIRSANTLIMLGMVTFIAAKTAITERHREVDEVDEFADDRGEVVGWAIAAGAACLLAIIVFNAYSGVIHKWVGKIK